MITKKQLIFWSIARDAMNWMLVGQIPGICQVLDIPLLIMHYKYAGAKASFTLLELIPAAGFIPIFSIAAFCYSDFLDPAAPTASGSHSVNNTQDLVRPCASFTTPSTPQPCALDLTHEDVVGTKHLIVAPKHAGVYAYVEGKLIRIQISAERMKRIESQVRANNL